MARRLFFVEEVRSGKGWIRGEEAHHLTRVLRVEAGQVYEISDNAGLYLAEVETARKNEVVFAVKERLEVVEAAPRIELAAGLIRFERFEWMMEKATELGAAAIHPLIAERSEKGLEQAAAKRTERWRRIAREACEQSRRARLPEIHSPARRAPEGEFTRRLVLDEAGGTPGMLEALGAERGEAETVALAVGPEGGWTEREREAWVAAGWKRVTLGPGILRAETAAVAALAVVRAAWLPYHEEQCRKK